MQRFFDDLNATVTIILRSSGIYRVGFLDSAEASNGSDLRADAASALQTSQTMVALTSPEYFRSERAGKEYQIFQLRERLSAIHRSNENGSSITPITWIPSDHAVWDTGRSRIGQSIAPYIEKGLQDFRMHIDQFTSEYVRFLMELTDHVVSASKAAALPPLDLTSLERVDNPFRPFRAVVVEKRGTFRTNIEDALTEEGFQVFGYDAPADVPAQYLVSDPALDAIDLFIVDLGHTESHSESARAHLGIDLGYEESEALALIGKIKQIHTKPGRMAMATTLSSENTIKAMTMGAEDVVSKITDIKELRLRMKNLAGIGRSRRLYSQGFSQTHRERKRPVFLSYSSRDNDTQNVAIFLKSRMEAVGIGVWYFEENQSANNAEAARRAFEGVADAEIFLPLITADYPLSTPCLAELISCFRYPTSKRILMPVLHGSAQEIKNFDWIKPLLNQHWDLSRDKFLDDLTGLMGWLQEKIGRTSPSTP
ncbi:MAG TPA: TIR domain-containing protein [Pyrinomonadaceae bacterium]|nr:TIR domain-containing protein [Pyrinomonadaceae bacterium]